MYMNISNDKANTSLLFQIQVIKISILKCQYEKICKVATSLIFFYVNKKNTEGDNFIDFRKDVFCFSWRQFPSEESYR